MARGHIGIEKVGDCLPSGGWDSYGVVAQWYERTRWGGVKSHEEPIDGLGGEVCIVVVLVGKDQYGLPRFEAIDRLVQNGGAHSIQIDYQNVAVVVGLSSVEGVAVSPEKHIVGADRVDSQNAGEKIVGVYQTLRCCSDALDCVDPISP